MFGRAAQQQKQIVRLQIRVRHLESLVQALAERSGVSQTDLAEMVRRTDEMIPEQCRRLVAEGKHIEAIKVYREHTGAGLKDAKDEIDRYRESL